MAAAPVSAVAPVGARRWVVYQRERFPVAAHGALILAFSSGAVCFTAQLRAAHGIGRRTPALASLAVAFVCCLLFFLQLRIADEYKDADQDARYRPYRPVPRGLVTLHELWMLAAIAAVVQLASAAALTPRLLAPLLIVWGYMALMTKEFWAHEWLRTRPFTVLWSHMLIMPLIDFFATSCDWLARAHGATRAVAALGSGLAWFLAASFFNGMVVEIGRKLRAPADEETGVDTYTATWGRPRAVTAWLLVMSITLGCAGRAAAEVGPGAMRAVVVLLGVLLVLAVFFGTRLVRAPRAGAGKVLETLAGLWTITMYLSVGVLPLMW